MTDSAATAAPLPQRDHRHTRAAIMSLTDVDREPALREILQAVSEASRISVKDLCGPCRMVDVVRARMAFYYLARMLTSKSLPQVGRVVGDRDHSTVSHGVNKVSADRGAWEPLLSDARKRINRAQK